MINSLANNFLCGFSAVDDAATLTPETQLFCETARAYNDAGMQP